jgi:cell division protein FtsQ
LSIRSVVVEGNVYTNQAQLDQILGQIKGDAILTADLHGAARQIEAMPWVRKARVSMQLPSRVLVQIDERRPAAFYRAVDGFIRVIDREGRILDVIEGDPIDYVRIIGTGPNLAPGDFVGQPFKGAVSLAEALPASLADRLVSVTTSPEGEISVQLSPNLLIIFGQPTDFQVKLVAVINEMKRQGTRSYTVIDVSTGEPNVR